MAESELAVNGIMTRECHGILSKATSLSRGGQRLTEHVLLAFLENDGRVLQWILKTTIVDIKSLISNIRAFPWIDKIQNVSTCGDSQGLTEVFDLMKANCTEPFREIDLFASLMAHPRAIGRYMMQEASEGEVNALTVCEKFQIPTDGFRLAVKELRKKWANTFFEISLPSKVNDNRDIPGIPSNPIDKTDKKAMKGPTSNSNWMIPGRVLLGRVPGGGWGGEQEMKKELAQILSVGVTTFVNLLEWDHAYVPHLQRRAEKGSIFRPLTILRFPIDDFDTADDEFTAAFVEELGRRLRQKKDGVIYIHCLSGRGRTGTIAIPLLMSLYNDLSEDDARDLVNIYKRFGRVGRTSGGHMPEDPSQLKQIKLQTMKYKRGGHPAKAY